MLYTTIDSPLGEILIGGEEDGLSLVHFQHGRRPKRVGADWTRADEALREPRRQLEAYFAGELEQFDLPLRPRGTPFQQTVWQELARIPYGETTTYGELAAKIGRPTASRAVGAANGRNPIAIVIPCHRVIGRNGKLTGYYGGIDLKEKLLTLEHSGASTETYSFFGQDSSL